MSALPITKLVAVTAPEEVIAAAFNAASVSVRSPVLAPVADVVHATQVSALSSQISPAFATDPRSITIPASPVGVPVLPLANSMSLSSTLRFTVSMLVVVPSTVKSPETVTLPSALA